MRTARTITLVLLGGGVVLGGAAMLAATSSTAPRGGQRNCSEARAQNRPDAEQICASARSATGYHGGTAWLWGYAAGASRNGPALADASGFRAPAGTSGRGGFGSTARGYASSSSGS